jgi:CRP/FNR family transcriptional regulator
MAVGVRPNSRGRVTALDITSTPLNRALNVDPPLDREPADATFPTFHSRAGATAARASLAPSGGGANGASANFLDLVATLGAAAANDPRLAEFAFNIRRANPGETLHRAGAKFDAVHIVRAGFFKTVRFGAGGSEQVASFPMIGDVIGIDSVGNDQYTTDAIALDTGAVIVVPFGRLVYLARENPCVERLVHTLFARELAFTQSMVWLHGSLSAGARVAVFLLNLSDRFGNFGYSRTSFQLRMTRQELGSYLGLTLETVSRVFSAFATGGLLDVDRRAITLHDLPALRRLVGSTERFDVVKGLAHV